MTNDDEQHNISLVQSRAPKLAPLYANFYGDSMQMSCTDASNNRNVWEESTQAQRCIRMTNLFVIRETKLSWHNCDFALEVKLSIALLLSANTFHIIISGLVSFS